VLMVELDPADGVTQVGIPALWKSEVWGPLAPLLGLEPDRRLSDVEERERNCTGDPPPTKLGGRDLPRRSGVGNPFCNLNHIQFVMI